jgi:colicin import membrane protein
MRLKAGLTISLIGHAAVLLWGLAAFAAKPNDAPPVESLPVEFVSAKEFSQLTAGVKNAPKPLDQPKPLADKVGDVKPVKQLASKVADKPEVTTDAAAPPQPKTEPKPEPKPEAKPQAKPEPKPAETADKPDPKPETKPEPKPDQIAQELKKEAAKKPPKPAKKPPEFKPDQIAAQLKKDEAKAEEKPRQDDRKFDANQVAALLDKRETTRQVATADTINPNPALGGATGHAAQLSQSELDALRARLSQCWSPPAGIDASTKVYVVLHVMFKPDGSVMGDPAVVEDPGSALGSALTESAKRALLLCQPFTMLKPEHYDLWKDIEVKFDPQELLGG